MGYGFANELLSGGLMTTPRLNDSAGAFRYQYAVPALAANRIITLPLLTGNSNFVFDSFPNVFTVTQTITQTAVAAGASALIITPGAHTAVIAEVNGILINGNTITVTGNFATQRFNYLTTNTITSVGAQTITTATTFEIQSAPSIAGSAAITSIYGFNFSGGAINIANIAGTSYRAIRTGAHTVTLTTVTQMTALPSIAAMALNIITIAQSGGAVTVDQAATLYISGAPTAAAGVTLTTAYALFIDAGVSRFDGGILANGTITVDTTADISCGTGSTIFTNNLWGTGAAVDVVIRQPTGGRPIDFRVVGNAGGSDFIFQQTVGGNLTIASIAGATGLLTLTNVATAGGAQSFLITPGAHTAVIAEVIDVSYAAHTMTITGNYATQRFVNWASPTVTSVGVQTITTTIAHQINGPLPAGAAVFTNSVALDIPTYVTNGTTASGLRVAAPSGAGTNWAILATGKGQFSDKIYPGTDAAAAQTASGLYAGTGAPNNANGSDGDIYFRSDGGALTTVYQRRVGVWVGVV